MNNSILVIAMKTKQYIIYSEIFCHNTRCVKKVDSVIYHRLSDWFSLSCKPVSNFNLQHTLFSSNEIDVPTDSVVQKKYTFYKINVIFVNELRSIGKAKYCVLEWITF